MARSNRLRTFIENVQPLVDNGLYPIKREPGDTVHITADIFRDGHQKICAWVKYRVAGRQKWNSVRMECTNPGLDFWEAEFTVEQVGFYEYNLVSYCDDYATWVFDTRKKVDAGVDYHSDILEGIALAARFKAWLQPADANYLKDELAKAEKQLSDADKWLILSNSKLEALLSANPDPETLVESPMYKVRVDRVKARFAAWYECFPRSCAFEPGKHGTFKDVIKRLPHIAGMGFDVLYFTPFHPVGYQKRKGPNNSLVCGPNDPGCPYSIGNEHGGHDAVNPELGTMEDFEELVKAAAEYGIELAMDFAINCSPDHPYLKDHPDWFSKRPDGTIKFAENPPKKYEDIYPINFECDKYKEIYDEMLRLFCFWAGKGVKIFRIDNPHTKPFRFWQWVIAETQKKYPDAIFLAEAFTRPRLMKSLAKLGFTQSYSYFTWRNEKQEIMDYFKELTTPPESDFYRANLFTNTPDIFPYFLQTSGRAGYQIRAVLATTLSTVYGMFQGFELCEGIPVPGKEEYLNSDKYEVRCRDWNAPGNIVEMIAKLNRIRKENPALQEYDNLEFYRADNDKILFYGKSMGDNHIMVVVNLDPFQTQCSTVYVPIDKFGISEGRGYEVHDLLTDNRYWWTGSQNYVELNPEVGVAHVFLIKK